MLPNQASVMRRTLLYFFLIVSSISYAQDKDAYLDSLKIKLSQADSTQWVNIALEISQEVSYQNPEYAQSLIDESIDLSLEIGYQNGLSKSYEQQAILLYNRNKVLSGISFYKKAYEIHEKQKQYKESANMLFGIATGLSRIYQIEESKDTLDFILQNYAQATEPITKSAIYHLLSQIYSGEGKNDLAILALDTAIIIEKENYLLKSLSKSYNTLGNIHDNLGNYKSSLMYYNLCEKTAKDINDTLIASYAIYNKAYIYLYWGIFDEALKLFLESQELAEKSSQKNEIAASLSSIASVYHEMGNHSKAKHYYLESLKMADKYDDQLTKAVVLHNFGELMYIEQKYDTALKYLLQSLQLEMTRGNTIGIAQTKSMLGTVNISLNNYDIGFAYFKEAEKVFEKFGSKNDMSNLFLEYAKTYEKLQKDSLSVVYFEKGIDLASKINNRTLLKDGYKAASSNYERLYNYKKALLYFKKHKTITDSIFNQKASHRIDYMSLKLETQEQEKKLSKLENTQKVTTLENKNRTVFLLAAIFGLIISMIFFYWRYRMKKKAAARLSIQYHILEESEQKIKALLDASFDSTLLVDLKGNILTINKNQLNGFFSNTRSMVNKELFSYFNNDNNEKLKKLFNIVINSKKPKEIEIYENNSFILNTRISPVLDSQKEVNSLAFYIKDITQIEKVKKEKQKMEKKLIQTQKMETIGTLAGGIAHDFNNSLATVQGYVSMILEDVDPKSHLHRYLLNTQKAVTLSKETVQKLMIYSRAKEIVFNKVRLDELIEDSMDIIMGSKPKNIQLQYPTKIKRIEFLADKNQLTQVIVNICTNAFHAIDDEKGTVTLSIKEEKTIDEYLFTPMTVIKISDSGIGMDNETKKRIFEPFFTTKSVGKGTGLGLSVVAGIIKQHKGKIEVKSEFGKGSTFTIYLPTI